MQQLATNHYAVLDVPRNATPQALRRAYLGLVRTHTPEADPETFRLVSEAYRVLSNPEKRKRYDLDEALPPAVEARLRRITDRAMEEPERAEFDLRALCREHFDLRAPRFTLGVLLARIHRYDEAATVFDLLSAEYPNNGSYAKWLGDALLKSGDVQNGLAHLKQAIVLDRDDLESYICLARFHLKQRSYAEALDALDRGLQVGGAVDINDIHLLVHKMLVQARMGAADAMRSTADVLVSVVPSEDAEARRWGAERLRILHRTFEEAQRADLALIVRDTMRSLDPENATLRQHAERKRKQATAKKARVALLRDSQVAAWVRDFVEIAGLDPEDRRAAAWREKMVSRLRWDRKGMFAAWDDARGRHPAVVDPLEGVWRGLLAMAHPPDSVPPLVPPKSAPVRPPPSAPARAPKPASKPTPSAGGAPVRRKRLGGRGRGGRGKRSR